VDLRREGCGEAEGEEMAQFKGEKEEAEVGKWF